LIEEGKLTVDGRAALARSRLLPGQQVRLEIPAPRKLELLPEDRPLDILYQDEHIVVVNKAAGLTVHPSETQHDGTLVHALLHHIKDLSGIGGVLRPGIVHRLDKDTSGALVVSKTDAAHQKLVETFSAHRIERRYWALCYGLWRKPETKIESTIGRSPSDRKKMAIHVRDGRQAVTWVRGIENYGGYASWIEARLETGRTHQVRLHLNSTGNSLLGDPVYGTHNSKHQKCLSLPRSVRECVQNLSGQALHARVLGFDHPITGEALRFEAAPPQAWQTLLETLQKEANSSS
jgi:23S rRNA pseudouridine1911/1915/1917 synthase